MPSIAERKRRKQQADQLRRSRMNLLIELDSLKEELCDNCKSIGSGNRSAHYKCGCPAATRMRSIGQRLLTLTNERPKIEEKVKEVKKVTQKNKSLEITEKVVEEMKASGMTYAAIAKHFGISPQTLSTRRQNWELERVRAQRQGGKSLDKPQKPKSVTAVTKAESSAALSGTSAIENEVRVLKEALIRKMDIIQEQQITIDQLKAECDELAKCSGTSDDWQKEIMDERKLLAVLLERETARIKNLVEIG